MLSNNQFWKKLLLFSLGLSVGAAFCMKYIESEFEGFSILGLELFYSPVKLTTVFQQMGDRQLSLLRYNLGFDFVFMAGIYPLIASLCMISKSKTGKSFGKLLVALAYLQIIAWVCDIIENIFLLKWSYGSAIDHFAAYHLVVWLKWVLAISGILFALPFIFRRRNYQPAL